MLKTKVKPQWMVLVRHFGMSGGIFNYGEATISEFFDSLDKANDYAERLLEETNEGLVEPMIWVLKCERTYQRAKEGLCFAEST